MKGLARVGTMAAVVGLLALGGALPAWSDDKEGDVAALAKDATVTAEQAIKTATEKVAGTVVEAELEKKHDKTVWEVEVLASDGKVTEVHIDAASGAVIDVEEKKAEHEKGEKKEHKKKKGK